jgi:hypothetical protein
MSFILVGNPKTFYRLSSLEDGHVTSGDSNKYGVDEKRKLGAKRQDRIDKTTERNKDDDVKDA